MGIMEESRTDADFAFHGVLTDNDWEYTLSMRVRMPSISYCYFLCKNWPSLINYEYYTFIRGYFVLSRIIVNIQAAP